MTTENRNHGTTFHCCLSIRGALSWPRSEAKRMLRSVTKDDGTRFGSVEELRNAFMDELVKGREVLPMSRDCDNFDYKQGCRGHKRISDIAVEETA